MRINKYLALATGMSRRSADQAVEQGRVTISGATARAGDQVSANDRITLDSRPVAAAERQTLLFNKPVGVVVSRNGQGAPTVYDHLPAAAASLKPIGRLDKDSSGLLLLTNDGQLAERLSHPRHLKTKIYRIQLDRPLAAVDATRIQQGISVTTRPQHGPIDRYVSQLELSQPSDDRQAWTVTMSEGRNRQIRRTFAAAGYRVTKLHRTHFGSYRLDDLKIGEYRQA
ncbi:ribosomal large subunit pseudouridine synthase B [Candidatus Saccharibacteria bacterium]|nr:MAG: ribosomal large subunit pseudouridine synthase B [Candidatus Saccharibacteria bacterium]